MSDSEESIEDIREQKRQELLDQARQQQDNAQGGATADTDQRAQKDAILKQILTEDARKRLNAVRMAHEDRAEAVETQLIQLAQTGRLTDKLDEDRMKELLQSVADSESNDFNIRPR